MGTSFQAVRGMNDLLPAQAAQLIAVAERAPYGRGGETLVDTAVRSSWQMLAPV